MSNIKNIRNMVTIYKGYTLVLSPFAIPHSWLVYHGPEFIAKVGWLPDAWALIDARIEREQQVTEVTVEAL